MRRAFSALALVGLLAGGSPARSTTPAFASLPPAPIVAPAAADQTPVPAASGEEPLEEIIIHAPEPRFVAPTRRDRIGRIWAPVMINGHGPFRLVLDSGASHSGVTLAVAQALGLPLDQSPPVLLRGVTGSAQVPTVRVDTFEVGDLIIDSPTVLPIIIDALGGAQGILGTNGLLERRIVVDFRHDMISIARSHQQRAQAGFLTIPFKLLRGQLLAVDARVGNVRTTIIIDTGGQVSIANLALRDALWRERQKMKATHGNIEGVTRDLQEGDTAPTPPIYLGDITLQDAGVTFGDMHIFEHWQLTREPTLLLGMDALGLFDTLIIDYKSKELQIKMHNG
jgi:hypothetical protein